MIGDYFPSHGRSAANGAYLPALALGPAFIAPVAVWFLPHVGWQGMFRWLALPGFVMALLIFLVIPRRSRDTATSSERAEAPVESARFVDVTRMLTSWLIFIAYMAFNIAFWGYLGWMPSCLSLSRHIELKALGFAASMPYLAGTVGMFVFGWLGSKVLYRHRCLLIAAVYLCTAVCLYVTYNVERFCRGNAVESCKGDVMRIPYVTNE